MPKVYSATLVRGNTYISGPYTFVLGQPVQVAQQYAEYLKSHPQFTVEMVDSQSLERAAVAQKAKVFPDLRLKLDEPELKAGQESETTVTEEDDDDTPVTPEPPSKPRPATLRRNAVPAP